MWLEGASCNEIKHAVVKVLDEFECKYNTASRLTNGKYKIIIQHDIGADGWNNWHVIWYDKSEKITEDKIKNAQKVTVSVHCKKSILIKLNERKLGMNVTGEKRLAEKLVNGGGLLMGSSYTPGFRLVGIIIQDSDQIEELLMIADEYITKKK